MMIIKNISKHIPHYTSLVGIFTACIMAFIFFPDDKLFLMGVSLACACAYISWGIIHHLIHKDLYLTTVLEYIVVSILGLTIVISLIFRS